MTRVHLWRTQYAEDAPGQGIPRRGEDRKTTVPKINVCQGTT